MKWRILEGLHILATGFEEGLRSLIREWSPSRKQVCPSPSTRCLTKAVSLEETSSLCRSQMEEQMCIRIGE